MVHAVAGGEGSSPSPHNWRRLNRIDGRPFGSRARPYITPLSTAIRLDSRQPEPMASRSHASKLIASDADDTENDPHDPIPTDALPVATCDHPGAHAAECRLRGVAADRK